MKKNVYEIQEQKKDESHLDKKKILQQKFGTLGESTF